MIVPLFGAGGWHLDYGSDFALGWFVAISCVCFPREVYFHTLVLQFLKVEFDIAFPCRL